MSDYNLVSYECGFKVSREMFNDGLVETRIPWWRVVSRIKYGKVRHINTISTQIREKILTAKDEMEQVMIADLYRS